MEKELLEELMFQDGALQSTQSQPLLFGRGRRPTGNRRMQAEGRIVSHNWDMYDTRHVVFQPARLKPDALEAGYGRAYRDFYAWAAIWRGAAGQDALKGRARHLAYAGGWRKFEPLWDLIIRTRRVNAMLPALERTLDAFVGARKPGPKIGKPSEQL